MNFDTLKNTLVRALSDANIGEYEIYYMSSEELSVDTLNKEQNSFSSGVSGGICFRVLYDGKMGYAASELMEEGEMKALVSRAVENAKATEKPDTVGIFANSGKYFYDRYSQEVCGDVSGKSWMFGGISGWPTALLNLDQSYDMTGKYLENRCAISDILTQRTNLFK